MKAKLLTILFSFFLFFFLFSIKNSAFAVTCTTAGGSCVPSQICNAEGFGTISGTTGCTTSQVCCRFTPTNTPTPTPRPTCTAAGGSCVTSQICNAEGLGTISGTTGCTTTAPVCCRFNPTPTPTKTPTLTPTVIPPFPTIPTGGTGTCAAAGGHCAAFSYCDAYGTTVDGTGCTSPTVCCKDNPHAGECPMCPPSSPNPDLQYYWDSSSQTCINDRGTTAPDSSVTWQHCLTGQSCYSGQGCVNSGFSNGQLPCPNGVCTTAIGGISTDPQGLVKIFFGILLSIAGMLAVVLIIISGYRLTTSQGNPETIQNAREQLTAAIVGLIFIILSFTILRFIGINILNLPGQ